MDSGLDKQLPDSPASATTSRASRTTPSSPPFYGAGSLRRYTTRRDSRASINTSPASHRDRNLSDVSPPADSRHQFNPRRDSVDLAELASRLKALEETVEAHSQSQRRPIDRVGRLEGALRVREEVDCLQGHLADVASWKEGELVSHVRWFQQRFEALRVHVEEVFAVRDRERHELLIENDRMSRRMDAAAIDLSLMAGEHQLLKDRVGRLSRSIGRLSVALQVPANEFPEEPVTDGDDSE
ncbi:uncharacterized protein N7515_010079 [Penicillium bovifimosum]|uniref:Uncharacterized protein n=1 Tax=Penicillium bovifimosum TaxID=126998 RepID=A0A9W9GI60_9EURO|nr:uncharacterized protein N7515_010079 [Penicillium bovifimosum]KAJ5120691.1 hypothetical protein N7515_010079 [Penicillium bovifimosum]